MEKVESRIEKITIEVDRKALIQALQSGTHNRILLCHDYEQNKSYWRESLDVDGCGVTGGDVRLTIERGQIDKPALGAAEPAKAE